MQRSHNYDVIIVGGSMVGATLACALAETPLRVALIESSVPGVWHAGDDIDLRVSAITRASQQIFIALHAWEGMAARRVSPFREMQVWDAAGNGRIHFDSAEIGEAELGHIIENRVIQLALWEQLIALHKVDILCPMEVSGIRRHDDGMDVQLTDGRTCTTRLVIGADGAQSRIRRLAHIATRGWNYDQHAVVATVHTEHPHRETAWQGFLPDGPLAFLPLNDGRCSIVWSTTPRHAEKLLAMDEAEFCRAVEQAHGSALGRIEHSSARASFPLRLQYIDTYVQPRLALIGDAAHTVHPLAGQGVNLGILDAACLAEVITEAHAAGEDFAAMRVLRRYERRRKGHNLAMMAAMDGFKRLFGTSAMPARLLRNLGLNLTHSLPLLKNLIMSQAMGLKGELPELAKAK